MKITNIKIEGQTGYTATMSRESSSDGQPAGEYIKVELRDPKGRAVATHHVQARDRDDQYSMSECVQHFLDGGRGTNSMIHDYFRMITMLAD